RVCVRITRRMQLGMHEDDMKTEEKIVISLELFCLCQTLNPKEKRHNSTHLIVCVCGVCVWGVRVRVWGVGSVYRIEVLGLWCLCVCVGGVWGVCVCWGGV